MIIAIAILAGGVLAILLLVAGVGGLVYWDWLTCADPRHLDPYTDEATEN